VKPALATTRARFIGISSPYAPRGWAHRQWQRHHGCDTSKSLVWVAESRRMNETLPQSLIDDALQEDRAAALSEYYAQWREDVGLFLGREAIQACVVADRQELLPFTRQRSYSAFIDTSGGRGDDAAIAIAHRHEGKVVIDLLRRFPSPHDPHEIVRRMSELLHKYDVNCATGDAYSAEWATQAFSSCGIHLTNSAKNRSQLYLELLPRLCSKEIELPDNERLVNQLASLERRTRSGGRDVVDHAPGAHDDLSNVVAGVADVVCQPQIVIGAMF
jgi:hypothetical protein